eukprot:13160313-Alexandrium_andersonii.AAC.1
MGRAARTPLPVCVLRASGRAALQSIRRGPAAGGRSGETKLKKSRRGSAARTVAFSAANAMSAERTCTCFLRHAGAWGGRHA